MSDEYLFCNYKNCKAPITKCTWVTRCSHVFCENHGNAYFLNDSSKVRCPACKETNSRETDVIKTNLDPHDMMLSCVTPEKTLDYVVNSCKLWSYQMQQKRKFSMAMLSEKYEKMTSDAMSKLKVENNEMKKFIMEVEGRLKMVNKELDRTKKSLQKYKMAYHNLCASSRPHNPGPREHLSFSDMNSEDILDNEVGDLFRRSRFTSGNNDLLL